jgi:hypothetical protein
MAFLILGSHLDIHLNHILAYKDNLEVLASIEMCEVAPRPIDLHLTIEAPVTRSRVNLP